MLLRAHPIFVTVLKSAALATTVGEEGREENEGESCDATLDLLTGGTITASYHDGCTVGMLRHVSGFSSWLLTMFRGIVLYTEYVVHIEAHIVGPFGGDMPDRCLRSIDQSGIDALRFLRTGFREGIFRKRKGALQAHLDDTTICFIGKGGLDFAGPHRQYANANRLTGIHSRSLLLPHALNPLALLLFTF